MRACIQDTWEKEDTVLVDISNILSFCDFSLCLLFFLPVVTSTHVKMYNHQIKVSILYTVQTFLTFDICEQKVSFTQTRINFPAFLFFTSFSPHVSRQMLEHGVEYKTDSNWDSVTFVYNNVME